MANDENKIILEFPATNVEIEFGETITFDNISGFLNSDRVTYNGESLTEEIAHLENDKADNTKIAPEYDEEETYYRGDIVLYNGVLYECDNTDASGEFNPSDWKEITLGEGIEDVRALLDSDYYTKSQSDYRFLGKTNPSGTGYFSLNRRGSTGAYSVSVGWHNEASAQSSFAEGENNASSGYASHSEGYGNNASGLMAHAEGVTTESSGYGSHSEGVGTIANHIGQHVIGTYNVADPSTAQPTAKGNYIEIVGNGTDDDRRRNARTLDWSGNETLMGDLTYNENKSLTSEISRLDGRIDNLPSPMIFKGTLGVGGTIQTLPAASASNEGYTYKVITDGTYAGQTAKVGDVFTSNGSAWVYIPSGDEDNDTWRNIKINGVEKLGNGISSGAVDFVDTDNIEVDFDGNGNKVGVKTKNIYTESEVDDIVYNILPDDTASGSVANFETDLALPIKSLEIDVNAKQDLHGQIGAYPAGGSAQKWDEIWESGSIYPATGLPRIDANAIRGVNFIPVEAGETYYAYMGTNSVQLYIAYWDNNDNYLSGGDRIDNRTFTVPTGATKAKIWTYGGTYSTYKNDISINHPATDTAYHPYSNICPIEGWSEVYLKRCKKNWFDKDTAPIVTGYIDANGFNINNYKSRTTYIKIPSGSTFTVTKIASARFTLATAKNPPVSGEPLTVRVANYSQATKLTITAGSEDRYLWLWFYLYDTDTETYEDVLNSIQIEVGSTETEYEPYDGDEYIIELGGTYYGGHLTQDKAGHRQFEVTHSELLDMGDIVWVSFDPTNRIYRANQLPNCKAPVSTTDRRNGFMCTNYPASANVSLNENMTDKSLLRYNGWIVLRDTSFSNYTEVAEGVRGAKLFYELATPYVIDLPDGEPIITLNGTNNIYADTGDTSVVFKDSVNGYVEKKIASVQALTLNT